MNKYVIIIFCFAICLFMPSVANAQNEKDKDKPKVVNVNKLDVIYEEEEEEYQPLVIDNPYAKDDKAKLRPPQAPGNEEDDEDEMDLAMRMYRPDQTGEDVDSEFDIIYATMDNETIHYTESVTIPEATTIHLTEKEKGRKFCFPTPETARMSSHFGSRRRRWHYGVDLAMPTGEPVYAVFDGIVRISKWNNSYGNLVVIRHFNGLETYYAHLSERDVKAGDTVTAGKVIGLCGNTGRSYGSHLHLEIRFMGKAMNPEYLLDCANHKLLADEVVLTPAYFRKVGSSRNSPDLAELRRVNRNAGTAANDKETLAQNQPKSEAKAVHDTKANPPAKQYYKVRSGDTLSKIAKRNGTTVKRLCQLNGLKETSILRIGQRIRVR
ncbi:MAG: peptidoglycan DD-metalloendopeptidase family protein [Bacteroidales bacterium]|nr:peptidoglycan DD-metalloendopeptidase family protein [Bacteroidales bacterium]